MPGNILLLKVLGFCARSIWRPPSFCLCAYNLPSLTLSCNNAIWHASKAATQPVMPDGWTASTGNFPLTELAPSPRYEKAVEAKRAYGAMDDGPQQALPALKRAQSRQGGKAPGSVECDLRQSLEKTVEDLERGLKGFGQHCMTFPIATVSILGDL